MIYLANGILMSLFIIYYAVKCKDIYIDILKFKYFNDSRYDAVMTFLVWIHLFIAIILLIIGINKI